MLNSTFPSSSSTSSLKRSISTPGTLFLLKTFGSENDVTSRLSLKVYSCNSISKLMSKISAEGLAKQLTVIDWSIFSSITRSELKPGQWTSPMKQLLSPNIVAFTRRFNNITFWLIDEILSLKAPKQRAEVISYFIKVCNYLIELNNLHSSYAIKSALTSASIHRLEKTWICLGKKDRLCFEKICDLFSETKNNQQLRSFMDGAIKSRSQSCIPNLATFLRDIIHIDCAYPQNEQHLSSHRYEKLESIYSFIEKCQQSNYDYIEIIEDVYDYLNSFNYIDELQKFREDNYFKLSQKLEPAENPDLKSKNKLTCGKFNSHYDIRALQSPDCHFNRINSSYDLGQNDTSYSGELLNKSLNEMTLNVNESSQFKPGHRKTNSLETETHYAQLVQYSNSLPHTPHTAKLRNMKINLIDDTLMFDSHSGRNSCSSSKCDRKPTLEMSSKKRNGPLNVDLFHDDSSSDELDNFHREHLLRTLKFTYTEKDLIHSALISRKTIMKDNKKPSITFWFNYYLGLSDDSLLFFSTKSYCQVKGFNSKPIKSLPLHHWAAVLDEPHMSHKRNTFTLAERSCSTAYRIKAASDYEAKKWVTLINQAIVSLKNTYFI